MPVKQTVVVTAPDCGMRLDAFLASQNLSLSRTRLQRLIDQQAITVNGQPQASRYSVQPGDQVQIEIPDPEPASPRAQEIPLEVVHEDECLLVINKPASLVVHPGAGAPDGTLVNALLARPGSVSSIGGVERPGIVHRLDKDTSGLLVVAKTDQAHRFLTESLAEREVMRKYLAIAMRRFTTQRGTIDSPIGRHPTVRTKMHVSDRDDARTAKTHYRVVEAYGNFSLVQCRLETGRTHQIRVHLAHINHPILGDDVYGGGQSVAAGLTQHLKPATRNTIKTVRRQMLHAYKLSFRHPVTGETLSFSAEPPEDFREVLQALRAEL